MVTGPANSPAVKLPNRSLPPGDRPRPIENGSPKLMTSGNGERGRLDLTEMAGRGFAISGQAGDKPGEAVPKARAAHLEIARRG